MFDLNKANNTNTNTTTTNKNIAFYYFSSESEGVTKENTNVSMSRLQAFHALQREGKQKAKAAVQSHYWDVVFNFSLNWLGIKKQF